MRASGVDRLAKLGVTIAKANQAADKLMDRPDKALSQGRESWGIKLMIAYSQGVAWRG